MNICLFSHIQIHASSSMQSVHFRFMPTFTFHLNMRTHSHAYAGTHAEQTYIHVVTKVLQNTILYTYICVCAWTPTKHTNM